MPFKKDENLGPNNPKFNSKRKHAVSTTSLADAKFVKTARGTVITKKDWDNQVKPEGIVDWGNSRDEL